MKIIFIILVLIFLYSQHKFINRETSNIEILQVNNPNKDKFEQMIMSNNPTVFTNVLNNINLTKKNIKKYFTYYLPPLCFNYNFEINQNKKNYTTKLIKQKYFRHLVYQLKGTKKLILFSPKEEKFLYPNKINNNVSEVNFWKLDSKVFPKFNNSSYLEIILHPRQMLYIPHNWWYSTKNISDCNSLVVNSETIFSKILKK